MFARNRSFSTAHRVTLPGFTLVEVLLSLSLLGVVLTIIFSVYFYCLLNWEREQEIIDVQDNLRWGLDCIAREVRQTANLYSTSSTDYLQFSGASGQVVEYFIEESTLYRKSASMAKQPVADHITRLDIQYGPRGLVDIVLAGQAKNTVEISFHTQVAIRVIVYD